MSRNQGQTGGRGFQQATLDSEWKKAVIGTTNSTDTAKNAAVPMDDLISKETAQKLTSVDVDLSQLTLAKKREVNPQLVKIENGVADWIHKENSVPLVANGPELKMNSSIAIGCSVLMGVKFNGNLAEQNRPQTRDGLKLVCLMMGVDVTAVSEDTKAKVHSLLCRQLYRLSANQEQCLTIYFNIMNHPDLTYLKARRYFTPNLKDLNDAVRIEQSYRDYWTALFSEDGWSAEEQARAAFNWKDPNADVYALCWFHPKYQSNTTAFREANLHKLDKAAAAAVVIGEKKENRPFPTAHKRFGTNGNRVSIYAAAKEAYEKYEKLEKQRILMNF